MKERASSLPVAVPAFVLGVVYVIYDDGRPLVEGYDGPQIVGMDLHHWCHATHPGRLVRHQPSCNPAAEEP